jgi:hypothetical protein
VHLPLGFENWAWGLGLIVLTVILHATGAAFMVLAHERISNWLERREGGLNRAFTRWIGMCAGLGLMLALLHAIEIGIWAMTYWQLGMIDTFMNAILYSADSMTTRGASGLMLRHNWQIMGDIEAIDGMLLFGISTAFIFAMMQAYWQKLAK